MNSANTSIHLGSFFFMVRQPQWVKASSLLRFHDHTQIYTPHSLGLLWTSDQPHAENT
jgi:hypothetical protein